MRDANSSDERPQPGKYKGFWEKFNESVREKADARKPAK